MKIVRLKPDDVVHRAPTSVDPSLEGPGVPDDVKGPESKRLTEVAEMMERLSRIAMAGKRVCTDEGFAHKALVYTPMLSALDDAAYACRRLAEQEAEIGRAVAMEREECAKVAEGWVAKNFAWSTIRRSTGNYIANAIRSRATLAGEGE